MNDLKLGCTLLWVSPTRFPQGSSLVPALIDVCVISSRRRRAPQAGSPAGSSTEGESSLQSQRSVVYLHAPTGNNTITNTYEKCSNDNLQENCLNSFILHILQSTVQLDAGKINTAFPPQYPLSDIQLKITLINLIEKRIAPCLYT